MEKLLLTSVGTVDWALSAFQNFTCGEKRPLKALIITSKIVGLLLDFVLVPEGTLILFGKSAAFFSPAGEP